MKAVAKRRPAGPGRPPDLAMRRRILQFVAAEAALGFVPSYRRIGATFGVAPASVLWHLGELADAGLVTLTPRGVRLVGARLTLAFTPDAAGRRLKAALEGGPS